jgi:hypothetical protein
MRDEIPGDGVEHFIHPRGDRFAPIPGPLSRVAAGLARDRRAR